MTADLRFHHVGIGTTKFDAAIEAYERLGYRLATAVDDPGLGVKVAFLASTEAGPPWIEILAPLGDRSPLRSLMTRGLLPSPYHTCYATSDLAAATADLKRAGIIRMTKPTPAVAFGGAPVAFFYSNAIGMVELVENPPDLAPERRSG